MSTANAPDENPVSRRSFLKVGLLGGTVVALGSGLFLATRQGKSDPAAPGELHACDAAYFPVLVAAVKRILPLAEDPAGIALEVDNSLSFAGASAKEINLVLTLLENGLAGVLVRGSSTPFTMLSGEAQDAVLLRWRDSKIAVLNAAYHGLRKVILGVYYARAERALSVGYPGPIWEKPDPGPVVARGPLSPPFVPVAVAPAAKSETSK